MCEGPPFMNRWMIRLAFTGKWGGFGARGFVYATSSEATDRPASPSMPKPAPLRRNISRRLIWDGLENSDEFCMSSTPSGDAIESAGKKDGFPPISRLNPVIRVTRPSLGRMSSVWVGRQAAVTSAASTFAKRCVHQTIQLRLDEVLGFYFCRLGSLCLRETCLRETCLRETCLRET